MGTCHYLYIQLTMHHHHNMMSYKIRKVTVLVMLLKRKRRSWNIFIMLLPKKKFGERTVLSKIFSYRENCAGCQVLSVWHDTKAIAMVWTVDTSLWEQRETGREPRVIPVIYPKQDCLEKTSCPHVWKGNNAFPRTLKRLENNFSVFSSMV